jgi:hypothetical protein
LQIVGSPLFFLSLFSNHIANLNLFIVRLDVERGSTNRQATHPAVIFSNTPQVVLKRRAIKTIPRPLDRLESLALVTLIHAR